MMLPDWEEEVVIPFLFPNTFTVSKIFRRDMEIGILFVCKSFQDFVHHFGFFT